MCLNVIKVGLAGTGGRGCRAVLPLGQEGRRGLSPPHLPACQVSVYLQNWSHVLSYVSKAESTPEIAEVMLALCPACLLIPCPRSPDHGSPSGPHSPRVCFCPSQARAGCPGSGIDNGGRASVAQVCNFLLQQRGERDSQTQAILTKLKCAAGEAPGVPG